MISIPNGIILVTVATGTGKSTSIKSLNPDETVIINPLQKRLPFKGSASVYNTDNKNLFNLDEYDKINAYLQSIDKNAQHVKNIVIDDITYIMRKEYFRSAKIKGFDKFVDMGAHFQSIISTAESMRDNINVFLIMHSEDIVSDNSIVGYKPSTIGKIVPVLLYSSVKYDENKNPIYGFYTHRCLEGSVEIPAKTPDGMFEEDFISNDLSIVIKAMNDYYN